MTIISMRDFANAREKKRSITDRLDIDREQEHELCGLFGEIKHVSLIHDPCYRDDPKTKALIALGGTSGYSILTYMEPSDKKKIITYFLDKLPDNTGILIEVRKKEGGSDSKLDIGRYCSKTFFIDNNHGKKGFIKKQINPKILDENLVKEVISLGYDECSASVRSNAFKEHPVISSLLGFPYVKEYTQKVSCGKFPYVMVDTNPDNEEIDSLRFQETQNSNGSRKKIYQFFYSSNLPYARNINNISLKYSIPVIFLSSREETKEIFHMVNGFYDYTYSKYFFGNGRNESGWLLKDR